MAARLGFGGGQHRPAGGIQGDNAVALAGGIDEPLDALRVDAQVGIGQHAAMEGHVAERVGDFVGRGVDGEHFAGGHLAHQQGAVLAGLAQEDALGLAAQRNTVTDGEGVDVQGDEFGGPGGGIEGAQPEVPAVKEVVVVVPGPGGQPVDVAGAADFLGQDVDSGDVRRAIAEDQDLARVTHFGGDFTCGVAAGRALRAAFAAGGREHRHAQAAHAGQQSSSWKLPGVHRFCPFAAGPPSVPKRGRLLTLAFSARGPNPPTSRASRWRIVYGFNRLHAARSAKSKFAEVYPRILRQPMP